LEVDAFPKIADFVRKEGQMSIKGSDYQRRALLGGWEADDNVESELVIS
jgi:hypothetical protein